VRLGAPSAWQIGHGLAMKIAFKKTCPVFAEQQAMAIQGW
jgi:hypothetical protein